MNLPSDAPRPLPFQAAEPASPSGALPPGIEAVVLSMSDVLLDTTGWRRWLANLFHELGMQLSFTELSQLWSRYQSQVWAGQVPLFEALREFLLSFGLELGEVLELEAAVRGQKADWESHVQLYPGVRATLHRLHAAGFPLAVLANTDRRQDSLLEVFARLEVAELFGAVVSSCDLRRAMPAAEPFHAVLTSLRVMPTRAVFVDTAPAHLAAARRLGIATVALKCHQPGVADARIEQLSQLADLLLDDEHRQRLAAAG